MINFAIVGAGKVAVLHAKAMARSHAARLRAVCDPQGERAEMLAVAYGAAVQPFEEILADPEITAVILATPSELHLDQARKMIEAGKHVLSEFPLFGTAVELEQVF